MDALAAAAARSCLAVMAREPGSSAGRARRPERATGPSRAATSAAAATTSAARATTVHQPPGVRLLAPLKMESSSAATQCATAWESDCWW